MSALTLFNIAQNKFTVNQDGDLIANKATLNGSVFATNFSNNNFIIDSSGDISLNGIINAGSGNFTVDTVGNVIANSLTLTGLYSIDSSLNILDSNNVVTDTSGNLIIDGKLNVIDDVSFNSNLFINGNTSINGQLNIGNGNFLVDHNGNLTVYGIITCNSISSISSVIQNNFIDLSSNLLVSGDTNLNGKLTIGNGNFLVDNTGNLTI